MPYGHDTMKSFNSLMLSRKVHLIACCASLVCVLVGFSFLGLYPEMRRLVDSNFDYAPVQAHYGPIHGLGDTYFYFPRVRKFVEGKFFVSDPLVEETRHKPVAHTLFVPAYALSALGGVFSNSTHSIFTFILIFFPLATCAVLYQTIREAGGNALVALGCTLWVYFYQYPTQSFRIGILATYFLSAVYAFAMYRLASGKNTKWTDALLVGVLALAPVSNGPYCLALTGVTALSLVFSPAEIRRKLLRLLAWACVLGILPLAYGVWQASSFAAVQDFSSDDGNVLKGSALLVYYFKHENFNNPLYLSAMVMALLGGSPVTRGIVAGTFLVSILSAYYSAPLGARIFYRGIVVLFHGAVVVGCCQLLFQENRITAFIRRAWRKIPWLRDGEAQDQAALCMRNAVSALFLIAVLVYAGAKIVPVLKSTSQFYQDASTQAAYDHAALLRWTETLTDEETILTLDGNLMQEISSYSSAWMYVPYVLQTALPHEQIMLRLANALWLYGYAPDTLRQKLQQPESALAENTLFQYNAPGHGPNLWLGLFYGHWTEQRVLKGKPFPQWATDTMVSALQGIAVAPDVRASIVIIYKNEFLAPLADAPLWQQVSAPVYENAHYVAYRLLPATR